MESAEPFTDEDLKDLEDLLRTDPRAACDLIHEAYQERVFAYIKKLGRGFLKTEDCLDAYQEVMLAFWQRAQRKDFDPKGFERMLFRMAHNKAIDGRRLKTTRRRHDHDLIAAVAADLKDTDVGRQWSLMDVLEREEFRQIVESVIDKLPDRQKVVAVVFVDNFEEFRARNTYLPLAERVRDLTGEEVSVACVKSAWRAVRERLITILSAKGFSLVEGMEP